MFLIRTSCHSCVRRYYPRTEGWTHVGTFEAKDEKAIQSFSIGNEEMFAKFVKVEILSHYGSEHFCPISLMKVLGTSVVEVYEREEHGADPHALPDEPEPGRNDDEICLRTHTRTQTDTHTCSQTHTHATLSSHARIPFLTRNPLSHATISPTLSTLSNTFGLCIALNGTSFSCRIWRAQA